MTKDKGQQDNIDLLVQRQRTVLDMVTELAYGHSVFYLDYTYDPPEFIFKTFEPSAALKHTFEESPERKIRLYDHRNGKVSVIRSAVWKDTLQIKENPAPGASTYSNSLVYSTQFSV